MNVEQRRGTRIPTRVFVRVLELDPVAVLREGNISMTGLFYLTDTAPGKVGAVERVELKTEDGALIAVTPTVIIRVARSQDLWDGEKTEGVALQFLPDDDATRESLKRIAQRAAATQLERENGSIDAGRLSAAVEAATASGTASVEAVTRSGLTLYTEWPVEPGATISLTIDEPTSRKRIALTGIVQSNKVVIPGSQFRLEVSVSDSPPARGADLDTALASLVEALVVPDRPLRGMAPTQALEGDLSRVALTSVFSFVEWEEWSGQLVAEAGGDTVTVSLAKGRPTDATADGAADPAAAIARAIAWKTGRFHLMADDEEREDRMQTTFRALLLDLARKEDEAGRR